MQGWLLPSANSTCCLQQRTARRLAVASQLLHGPIPGTLCASPAASLAKEKMTIHLAREAASAQIG